jgi:hypothetical protein
VNLEFRGWDELLSSCMYEVLRTVRRIFNPT